ncbi:MAG: hypothetical protein PHU14_08330 [Methylovulum sp.]|nr:hypothetical protein [Methylovulum sp.]
MYAYKETLTLENPQQLNLSRPLPFLRGKTVEVLVLVDDDNDDIISDETDAVLQDKSLMEQIALSAQTYQQHGGYQVSPEEINEILSI